jgi:hypothetical protein
MQTLSLSLSLSIDDLTSNVVRDTQPCLWRSTRPPLPAPTKEFLIWRLVPAWHHIKGLHDLWKIIIHMSSKEQRQQQC